MYQHRKRNFHSKANPNAEYMGFEHVNAYNDEHPDELHLDWMIKHDIPLPNAKKKRGRKPGTITECTRCGRLGHYAKTCLHAFDLLGLRIKK